MNCTVVVQKCAQGTEKKGVESRKFKVESGKRVSEVKSFDGARKSQNTENTEGRREHGDGGKVGRPRNARLPARAGLQGSMTVTNGSRCHALLSHACKGRRAKLHRNGAVGPSQSFFSAMTGSPYSFSLGLTHARRRFQKTKPRAPSNLAHPPDRFSGVRSS